MRYKTICVLTISCAILFICSCAYQAANHSRQESDDQYVGWVRFVGEFVLYTDRVAFEDSRRQDCVSGALPLGKQRDAARKLDGKKVKVVAQRVPWVLPGPLAISLNNDGSPITNWCGGDYVLFATEMVAE